MLQSNLEREQSAKSGLQPYWVMKENYHNFRPSRCCSAKGALPTLKKKNCTPITWYRARAADKVQLSKRQTLTKKTLKQQEERRTMNKHWKSKVRLRRGKKPTQTLWQGFKTHEYILIFYCSSKRAITAKPPKQRSQGNLTPPYQS